jgi:pimeloyl-ACP methyl ester carboxylesterase
MFGEAKSFTAFGERLAAYGFFCLSIDLPRHNLNPTPFTLGDISDTINDGLFHLKHTFGMQRVAVVGHSMGAAGTLFAMGAYTRQVEEALGVEWERLRKLAEQGAAMSKGASYHDDLSLQLDLTYRRIKSIIYSALSERIRRGIDPECYVMVAPPRDLKRAIPGLTLLRPGISRFPDNIIKIGPFKEPDTNEFLKYFLNMKESGDYISLLEILGNYTSSDQKTNFFRYYLERYIRGKPKMFLYGRWDQLLRPFMPSENGRLERYYQSFGNAEVVYGNWDHWLMKRRIFAIPEQGMQDDRVTEIIIRFLDRHM